MPQIEKTYPNNRVHDKRVKWTTNFVQNRLSPGSRILDLGPKNILSKNLEQHGYRVENVFSEDLDYDYRCVEEDGFDAFTSFEVFEHMVSPMPLLQAIKAPILFASVPLALWFSKAYRGKTADDPFDEHYHEFEPWQFELLLKKSGWKIDDAEFHSTGYSKSIGLRPILRKFYPRYMIVSASRT